MTEPDPRLRKALETVDTLRKELRAERIRTGNLRAQLGKTRRTTDAKLVRGAPPGC